MNEITAGERYDRILERLALLPDRERIEALETLCENLWLELDQAGEQRALQRASEHLQTG